MPTATPTTAPTRPPATPTPTPIPTAAPTASATFYPADPPSKLKSSYGRIALSQIFDYFPDNGGTTQMSTAQIQSDAYRYDSVWGSFNIVANNPATWRSSNPSMLVSRYYIIEEDNTLISGHNLQWWQQNHPDWILYACNTQTGAPTQDLAYSPGDGFADVALDMHNPAVVQYQINSLISYAQANGYNALALDNVIFNDFLVGGNPQFGQTENTGEYGCGIYNQDGTFTKVYQSPTDSTWTSDVLNWVAQAHAAAQSAGLTTIANHAGSAGDANEPSLLSNVDVILDETGFSDYGSYTNYTSYFNTIYNYMEFVQSRGVGFIVIDRYAINNETQPTSSQVEYGIATYLMGNEGDAELYMNANNGNGYGYGSEEYHNEYTTPIGYPCSAMTGSAPVFTRRFSGGMSIVNSGGSAGQVTLPANHTYTDIEGRAITNPLTVNASDSYVLTTTNGCS